MSELAFETFGNILSEDVLKKLIGEHKSTERIMDRFLPSKRIVVGNLACLSNKDERLSEDLKDLNSISVKFLLEYFNSPINIKLFLSFYYRVYPTFDEQMTVMEKNRNKSKVKLTKIWKRIDFPFEFILNNDFNNYKEFELDFTELIQNIKKDVNLVKKNSKIDLEEFSSEKTFKNCINEKKKEELSYEFSWESKLIIKKKSFNQDGKEYVFLEINLVNNTPKERIHNYLFDGTIFNPKFKLFLNNNKLCPFHYNKYYGDLRCLNCNGTYNREDNIILTQNYATFKQKKIVPKSDIDFADISFKKLSSESGIQELENIYYNMNEFYNSCLSNGDNNDEYQNQLNDFNEMKERFKKNILLLKKDIKVLKAFYLMNKTFYNNSKNSSYHGWRLFQIVFIVLMIKDIVCVDSERDTCELLHVMTGGGKSEAYFGIVIFTSFWDRLNGKKFGVSAITKFPLRMLSIQQLQRIANIFIHAEEIRKDEQIEGRFFFYCLFCRIYRFRIP